MPPTYQILPTYPPPTHHLPATSPPPPRQVRLNEWYAISASVDTLAGAMHVYVNGQLSCTVKGAQLAKDGQHAIKRRLALFWYKDSEGADPDECVYVRSVAIHSVVLDAEQVRTTPPPPPLPHCPSVTPLSLLTRTSTPASAPPPLPPSAARCARSTRCCTRC